MADNDKEETKNCEQRQYLRIQGFCLSSGFTKKKFSANSISSLHFMAPERIIGTLNDRFDVELAKADIWSVGAIIHLLVFGKTPFQANTNSLLIKALKRSKMPELKSFTKTAFGAFKALLNLIGELIAPDPIDRLDVAQALNHDFFTKGQEMSDFEHYKFTDVPIK